MLKRINIKSLLQAKSSLSEVNYNQFLNYYGIEIRDDEVDDLKCLSDVLNDAGCSIGNFDRYFVGFKIPQIGKEFDLLRFSREYILNIELKSSCTEDQVKRQLIRNKYYLSFVERKVCLFAFISEFKDLYLLNDESQLEKANIECLIKLLNGQRENNEEVLETLFEPSDYLVSPFNSTSKFLAEKYFLTQQQEDVKVQIIRTIEQSKEAKFVSIIGGAGTGKTLLAYDIARRFVDSEKKSLVIHCGQLNEGHEKLKENGWVIFPIKAVSTLNFEDFYLIVVDEAQRIYKKQLDSVIEKVKLSNCCCIFSHDRRQTLASWEAEREISDKICEIDSIAQYKLSEKVRTNKEIASFIKMLFNNRKSLNLPGNSNIEINFFNSIEDAKSYLGKLSEIGWKVLRFTPSQYNAEYHEKYSDPSSETSHRVIGQEFDRVAVTIDQSFFYGENGDLSYKGKSYYDSAKMLFQNISRCRKKLNLVIIANAEILNRCIAILR